MIMEYQKMINSLDDTTNQSSKFKTRNRVEIINESRGSYCVNSDIKFKTSMKRLNLYDYSDTCIHVKGNITVPNTAGAVDAVNNTNKKSNILKLCSSY